MNRFERNLHGSICNLELDMFKNMLLNDVFKFQTAMKAYDSILENNKITNKIVIADEEFLVYYNKDLFPEYKTEKVINSNNNLKIELLTRIVNDKKVIVAVPNKLMYLE